MRSVSVEKLNTTGSSFVELESSPRELLVPRFVVVGDTAINIREIESVTHFHESNEHAFLSKARVTLISGGELVLDGKYLDRILVELRSVK